MYAKQLFHIFFQANLFYNLSFYFYFYLNYNINTIKYHQQKYLSL